jgi:hypothetical protein
MEGSRNRFGEQIGYAMTYIATTKCFEEILNWKSKNKIDGMCLKQVYESDGTKTWFWMISTGRSQDKMGRVSRQ